MAACVAASLLAGGCAGERGPEDVPDPDAASSRSVPEVAPARYLTDLVAVPFSDPETAVYLTFRQEVTGDAVLRRYAGWRLDLPEGSRVLAIRDSLPAPRAAWRILPGPGLRVVAGEGEEPVSLVFDGNGSTWEVAVDSSLASWPGPTGQRERMLLGRLSADSIRPALVVVRRAARPLDAPAARARSHLFVLVDAEGRGLVVVARRSEPPPGAPSEGEDRTRGLEASVRIHDPSGGTRTLEGVRLVAGDTTVSAARWELRGPEGGSLGRIESEPARVEMYEAGTPSDEALRPGARGEGAGTPALSLSPARGSVGRLGGGPLRGLHVVVRGG